MGAFLSTSRDRKHKHRHKSSRSHRSKGKSRESREAQAAREAQEYEDYHNRMANTENPCRWEETFYPLCQDRGHSTIRCEQTMNYSNHSCVLLPDKIAAQLSRVHPTLELCPKCTEVNKANSWGSARLAQETIDRSKSTPWRRQLQLARSDELEWEAQCQR